MSQNILIYPEKQEKKIDFYVLYPNFEMLEINSFKQFFKHYFGARFGPRADNFYL